MLTFLDTLNLRHLRMVQMVGREGGINSASRALHASQPAVTQAISNFEAKIGTRIFMRRATGCFPTERGQRYLLHVDRFFTILDNALIQVSGSGNSPVERLTTGRQLYALIACADGSTRQPGRLRSARTLERTLGVPLFQRSAHGPRLNAIGMNLVDELRRALHELTLAQRKPDAPATRIDLEFHVGTLPMAGSAELAHAAQHFLAAFPEARVRVIAGDYNTLLADLRSGRIDILFGTLRTPGPKDELHCEILFRDRYCVVARMGHPLQHCATITIEQLGQYPWVVPALSTPRRTRMEAAFEQAESRPACCVETSSCSMTRALLLGSDSVTLMTATEALADLDLGVLVELSCGGFDAMLMKGIMTRSDWVPSTEQSVFLDTLRGITAGNEAGLERPRRCQLTALPEQPGPAARMRASMSLN
ncbi:LysR family transcriptional regulator [Pseudomonas sp. PS1(2021)]|uniref:LysR substrate-binding domain-containing protein n=1 Tax=Pseudomonas sp. PS1(2021) TaxID=2866282 RepID=UPI001CEFC16B|nr:LysR substrate-binding domain-containing protein [Pseudomonas sp. PS1(2021)]UCM29531.1 LysR family transcriptional regulator [Pseudomonas sp. PS1(2021)]